MKLNSLNCVLLKVRLIIQGSFNVFTLGKVSLTTNDEWLTIRY